MGQVIVASVDAANLIRLAKAPVSLTSVRVLTAEQMERSFQTH